MAPVFNFVQDYVFLLALIAGLIAFSRLAFIWAAEKWHWVAEVAFAWSLGLIYFLVRGMVIGRESTAFANARKIIQFEQRFDLFWEDALQKQALQYEWVERIANFIYVWGHWPVIIPVLIWLYRYHRNHYTIYRNAFLLSGIVGIVIFAIHPVAPPRFMPEFGFVDTVNKRTIFNNILLPPDLTNKYAAMPSLHAGWNMLAGIALIRHSSNRKVKIFGALMPILMFWAIIVTGNHYITDGLVGDLIAETSLVIVYFASRSAEHEQVQHVEPVPLSTQH